MSYEFKDLMVPESGMDVSFAKERGKSALSELLLKDVT
jgi:hypothetical protein